MRIVGGKIIAGGNCPFAALIPPPFGTILVSLCALVPHAKPNADGSADIYFGPTAPKAASANWIKTVPGKGYMPGIRLYSPTQAYFDKTWKPDDIVKVK